VAQARQEIGILTEGEAAGVFDEQARTWQSRRLSGRLDLIPKFIKVGNRVFYTVEALKEHLLGRARLPDMAVSKRAPTSRPHSSSGQPMIW
jgi:hypothetical protein